MAFGAKRSWHESSNIEPYNSTQGHIALQRNNDGQFSPMRPWERCARAPKYGHLERTSKDAFNVTRHGAHEYQESKSFIGSR